MQQPYTNPIIPGFRPDPSIVRVGDEYYLVNSTFQYFPGIAISRSRDLVHWETIGHALTRNDWLDMRELRDSRGFWAPDISFHDGLFYIFCTLRLNETRPDGSPSETIRRQMIVTAEKPEGPWSQPHFIDVDGIDPSHFVDDDGRHYMVLNPAATLVPLDEECKSVSGEIRTIWPGTGGRSPEGPHILKKDGWYHIILAEGGTGYEHHVTSARSRSLDGPWEENPHNPILVQNDRSKPIQKPGHAKFVRFSDGSWWAVYLCSRPVSRLESPGTPSRCSILGRETALDPVTWGSQGWPLINQGMGPGEQGTISVKGENSHAGSPAITHNTDDFDSPEPGMDWYTPRNPDPDRFTLTQRPGWLRLAAQDADLSSLNAKPFLRRQEFLQCTASCLLDFTPTVRGMEAGMTLYYDTKTWITLSRASTAKGISLRVTVNRGQGPLVAADRIEFPAESLSSNEKTGKTLSPVYLRIDSDGLRRSFLASADGTAWTKILTLHDVWYLCDEGYSAPDHKRFTGTMIGLFAWNGGSGSVGTADFDWFSMTENRQSS